MNVYVKLCYTAIMIKEDLQKLLYNVKKEIPDEALQAIDANLDDIEDLEELLVQYQDVLLQPEFTKKYNVGDYVNALIFVAKMEQYDGNATRAYGDTFRYRDFVRNNVTEDGKYNENVISAASRYRKNPLVLAITKLSDAPLNLLFQGYRYRAINALVIEMNNAKLARDRINAADRLLVHLTPLVKDEKTNTTSDNVVTQFEEALLGMVKKQQELLGSGEKLEKIANVGSYIEAEVVNE